MTETAPAPAPGAAPKDTGSLYLGTLYEFQADGVVEVYLDPAKLAVWGLGTGKQAPVSEPVLTPNGWTTMGALRPGDHVIGRDGRPTEVLAIHPQTSRTVYRLGCSDGSWTRCGPDHLWTVQYRKRTSRSAGPIRWIWVDRTMTTAELLSEGLVNSAGNRRWRLPITEPVQYPARDLPIDPYALGVILGDAWISPVGQVQLTTDKEILDALSARGERYPKESDGIEMLVSSQWAPQLREMRLAGCRSEEKFVPEGYLLAPEADRRALLAGLLDTDGSPMHTGGIEFCSTSIRLARAVIELTESLGGSARMKGSRRTSYTYDGETRMGQESWRVNVKLNEQPFRLARKMIRWIQPTKYPVARMISSIEQINDEDCVCITVAAPDGLYLTRHHLVTHNTHLSMRSATMMVEDGTIDHILVVCESGKLDDWANKDFPKWTKLSSKIYLGSKREKVLRIDPPQVIVTTYETAAMDLCKLRTGSKAVAGAGPLMKFLEGKRVFVVYDELTKLGNRATRRYKAHEWALNQFRKNGGLTVLGLTGTPIETSPDNYFNIGRLLMPDRAPLVARFKRDYIKSYDDFGNPRRWKNLTREEMEDEGVTPLNELFPGLIMRKRKTDPDVIDQFPKKMEEDPTVVELHERHRHLLRLVAELLTEVNGEDAVKVGLGMLRQMAGHPLAVLRSNTTFARRVVREVGEAGLRATPSAKTEAMLDWALRMGTDQGVLFTFYGPSILPHLAEAMTKAGFSVAVHNGEMGLRAKADAKESYVRGDKQFFLSSDAGCRGLNLGMGAGLLHYEPSGVWAIHEQRSDRIHRIDSIHESVSIQMLVAKDSPDESALATQIQRQEYHELVFDPDTVSDPALDVLTAADRRALLARIRRR